MTIEIEVDHQGWQAIANLSERASTAARLALSEQSGSVVLLLSGDAEIRILNREWRGMDNPTNVLAFPSAPGLPQFEGDSPILGDVIVAYETVAREAAEQGKPTLDHAVHLIVHGILHLIGYDHTNDDEAEIMENRERELLAKLGIADPYQT